MIADLILAAAALPPLAASAWLALLTAASRRLAPPALHSERVRFEVIVPAHDEEQGIARTVGSLLAVEYPRELFRVLVVADNCQDATAERARAAGAEVLVRDEPALRGKGYALALGLQEFVRGQADAAVVVDADTVVAPNLLAAFSARLSAGAQAVQADYGVANPRASWRTRLMHLGFSLFHGVRSLGRERLGLSCGLRGNGMCFSRAAVLRTPHDAVSLVEDVEHGIRLGENGVRVHYAAETQVWAEMVSSSEAALPQRQRWERGRRMLARRKAAPLLREALRRRSPILLDLALDLLIPPLSTLALVQLIGTVLSLTLAPRALSLWLAADLCIAAYLVRGLIISGAGLRGLLDLCWAPLYLAWKFSLALRRTSGQLWVRTTREKGR
jgi:1,2-diacylglycerol 3-beta-glucosyltransferase